MPVASRNGSAERCFTCPKERLSGESGWHFVDLEDERRLLGPARLYVCPVHYLKFAVSERGRWMPFADLNHDGNGHHPLTEPANGERAPCSADDLIAQLADRGLTGWVFLVRDVAAGRVRRVHLRQLPADPEIRDALVAYLHGAGTAVTVSRTLLEQHRRVARP